TKHHSGLKPVRRNIRPNGQITTRPMTSISVRCIGLRRSIVRPVSGWKPNSDTRLRLSSLLRCLLLSRFLGIRRQDGMQSIAFLTPPEFYDFTLADIFYKTLQNSASESGTSHLPASKKDRGLDLIAFIQKTQH